MTAINPFHASRTQGGLSLIELMISITIGMLIMVAMLALFINITRNNSELAKTNIKIENGRFAIQLLQNNLVHAGFWGELRPAVPSAIPDPCLAVVSWDDTYKANMLGVPVLGYSSTTIPESCTAVTSALPNSDVLVVRHANTCTFGTADCDGGADTGPHIQVSSCTASPPEAAYVINPASATTFTLSNRNCTTIAARRKIVSNIYYLANRASDSCRPATATCPTLMRTSLVNGAYTTQPLIEGIEAFRVEYGIDNRGRNDLAISTTNPGDGSADEYVSSEALATAEAANNLNFHPNVVAVKVHLLARNLVATPGYTDSKTYRLGNTPAIAAANDGFKRHVFSTTVRLVNPSSRREVP